MPAFLRALTARTLACTRCGSADVHPVTGAIGPLAAAVGFMRFGCRGCRRTFWIRAGAKSPQRQSPPASSPEVPGSAASAEARVDFDFQVAPVTHEKVDLTPLDAEFERLRTGGDARERPRLGDNPGPTPKGSRQAEGEQRRPREPRERDET